jgi:pimeloyl-ACP methyl ester carboxylesterase
LGIAAAAALVTGMAVASPSAQAIPRAGVPAAVAVPAAAANVVADTAAFTPRPVSWLKKCPASFGLGGAKAQCGYLSVPLDYAHPGGTKIKLAVSRVKHTVAASKYQGIMLVNPGGPGGSGVNLSLIGAFVPNKAGAAYDWIGFDPRGVGSSIPSLSCNSKYFSHDRPAYEPSTKKLEKAWLAKSKAYAKACDKAGGKLLDHTKTIDSVKDMESLRKALGRTQINFYGFSYGTYLGQVYSTLYPTRVRRMVFDGVVDPRGVWYQANLSQDIAFNRSIKIYFAWLAKFNSVYHLGKTEAAVEKLYYATQAKLDKKAAGGKLGGDELNDVILDAGYYVFDWEEIASALSTYIAKGDFKPLLALYDDANPQVKGSDNGYAMYLATQCTDAAWPKSWSKWKADNTKINAKAPFQTWSNAWFNAPCLNWGGKAGTPVHVNGTKAPKILLINETFDGATPYSGALEVRKLFPRSVLIEGVGGSTHAGSLNGVSCTDDTIATYLTTGKLPARVSGNRSDKRCAPVPQPDPTASAVASADAGRAALRELIG